MTKPDGVRPAGIEPKATLPSVRGQEDSVVSASQTAEEQTASPVITVSAPRLKLGDVLGIVNRSVDKATFSSITEEITFPQYLEKLLDNPGLIRTSQQRIFDMIVAAGRTPIEIDGENYYDYAFFRKTVNPEDAISGATKALHNLVEAIGSAAKDTGAKKRVILLAGPVGNSKTTIIRGLTSGLTKYTLSDEGTLYALRWDLTEVKDDPAFKHIDTHKNCEIFEDPFNVIPLEDRKQVVASLNAARLEETKAEGKLLKYNLKSDRELCPSCRDVYDKLLKHYDGDKEKALSHVRAKRLILDEKTRTGITFFGAKDEKSHKADELSGGVNMRKLLQIGSDSDPQSITLDGEVLRANRGVVHFGEFLKMPKEITYPLLDASQDRNLKVTKQALVDFDTFLIASTNIPDWNRVLKDEFQEAIRSRIFPITVPYLDNVNDIMGIYQKDFSRACKELGIHEAPWGRWTAALWELTTTLAEPTNANIDIVQKALLYSGKKIPGFTSQEVIQMKRDVPPHEMELLKGISPRDVQDALAVALEHPDVIDDEHGTRCADPYIIIDELKRKLKEPIANVTEEDKKKYLARLNKAERELDKKLLDDVRRAISGDKQETQKLFQRYISHIRGYVKREKVKDPILKGRETEPDEDLMKAIEEKMDIGESRRKEFRSYLMQQIGDFALEQKEFTWDSDERLKQALEEYLVDRHRNTALPVFDAETASTEDQEKIQVVENRLIKEMGYCGHCAKVAMQKADAPTNRGTSS